MLNKNVVKILFDTDIGCDCDDAGALAVLHALAKKGEAEILAVTDCTQSEYVPGCVDSINRYYGKNDIPLGTLKDAGFVSKGWRHIYDKDIYEGFEHKYPDKGSTPDAVEVMRRVLCENPDESVTIVATGSMRNLMLLLKSKPDSISPLNGKELIEKKVKRTIVMGGYFSADKQDIYIGENIMKAEFNIVADIEGARYVCDNWPNEFILSPYEIGHFIITGQGLVEHGSIDNPVRLSYKINCNGGRNSWDQTAMLYAIRPDAGYWDLHEYGKLNIDETGITSWAKDRKFRQSYLIEKADREEIKNLIDSLMEYEPVKERKLQATY